MMVARGEGGGHLGAGAQSPPSPHPPLGPRLVVAGRAGGAAAGGGGGGGRQVDRRREEAGRRRRAPLLRRRALYTESTSWPISAAAPRKNFN